jgi:hypothetical protein
LGGRHILVLNPSQLEFRRELFGLGRTQTFDTAGVSDWRYVPEQARGRQPALPAGFAFGVAGKEIRAGTAMDEAEVDLLFARIRQRFPNSSWAPSEKAKV